MSIDVSITVKVFPTEVGDRVKEAVLNIFPEAELRLTESFLTASTADLEKFSTKLRDQRIRGSARTLLHHCVSGEEIVFFLNKQAAFVGKVNFTEGDSVLGDIKVKIVTDEPEVIIDHLTLVDKKEEEQ
jgi:predicted RNA binding protein with dsRBD fold (UPF0201 family)